MSKLSIDNVKREEFDSDEEYRAYREGLQHGVAYTIYMLGLFSQKMNQDFIPEIEMVAVQETVEDKEKLN